MSALANYGDIVIYKSGGCSFGQKCTAKSDCERYDLQLKRWFVAPELQVARESHSSCSLGNYVYVFCGLRGTRHLLSVEQLDA